MVEFRHIINGCSVNIRQLTDRELASIVKNNQMRLAVINDELETLIGEQIRRLPDHSIHKGPSLF